MADLAIAQEARHRESRIEPDHHRAQRRLSVHRIRQTGVVMLRLTLAARLALIVITGFSAVAIVALAVFYMTSSREDETTRPSPGRLMALAALIERTGPDERRAVLEAGSSPQFVLRPA